MRKKKQTATASREGPSEGFRRWWEPEGTDEPSGACIGGHPDAHRIWARKEPGRWARTRSGTTTAIAWLSEYYRNQYDAWVDAGKPKTEPFISICASPERQVEWAKATKGIIAQIGKPIPKVTPKELNAEARRMSLPHKMIEPIDEDAIDFDHRNNEGEE